jgi:hypothetical protein
MKKCTQNFIRVSAFICFTKNSSQSAAAAAAAAAARLESDRHNRKHRLAIPVSWQEQRHE